MTLDEENALSIVVLKRKRNDMDLQHFAGESTVWQPSKEMAIELWRISRTFVKHRHIEFVFLLIDIGYYHAEKVVILL